MIPRCQIPISQLPMASAKNPAQRANLVRRPGCWIAILAIIPLLIGAAVCLENWLGARALARAKTRIASAGIDLDPRHLPSIRPPDAENFCATPLFLDAGTSAPGAQVLQQLENRIARWQHILHTHGVEVQSPSAPAPTDWTSVHDALAKAESGLGLIAGTPAPLADLGDSLDKELGSVFAELSAALPRPRSVFIPSINEKFRNGHNPYTVARNHVGSANSVALALSLRARTDLATGREPRAAETICIRRM